MWLVKVFGAFLGPLASLQLSVEGASTSSPLPWGPLHFPPNQQCPIVFPFSNETVFCNAVGRQRAVVSLGPSHTKEAGVACTVLEWRRRDNPLDVGVFVLDGNNTFLPARIENSSTSINGTVCFAIPAGSLRSDTASLFSVYYLPYAWSIEGWSGSFHSHFLARWSTPPTLPPIDWSASRILWATVVAWESYSDFDARSPMEWVASGKEIAAVQSQSDRNDYLTWVSEVYNTSTQTPRTPHPPYPVVSTTPNNTVHVQVYPGKTTSLQVLILAGSANITRVDFQAGAIGKIPSSVMSCIHTQGRDYSGNAMRPNPVHIRQGQMGHLLVLLQIPESFNACDTAQQGSFVITPSGSNITLPSTTIKVTATCSKSQPAESISAFWRLETMSWLDSSLGINDTVITRPYSPLILDSDTATVECRGRTIRIGANGLPAEIVSNGRDVLSSPMTFTTSMPMQPNHDSPPNIVLHPGGSSATWRVTTTTPGGVRQTIDGAVDYSCYVNVGVSLDTSAGPGSTADSVLAIQLPSTVARFASGAAFGDDGDFFPVGNASSLDWRWCMPDTEARGTCSGWRVWLGDVDAGLFVKLKGPEVAWNQAVGGRSLPSSWSNGGLGGIRFRESTPTSTVTLEAYTGPYQIQSRIVYNFSISVTPVKGDYVHTAEGKKEHYRIRHFHVPYGQWDPPDPSTLKKQLGVTTIILHQSNSLNPYIDYPLHPSVTPRLKSYIDRAAQAGVRVKLYFTLGQLSNHAVELFALASLNGEVIVQNTSDLLPPPRSSLQGMGGTLMGNEWLEEHMIRGYESGWFTLNPGNEEDASIMDNTTSRFMNYYVEGQRFLFNEIGVGGLYYDGFNAERFIQQRIRRMSSSNNPLTYFDVHGRAFMYTELLPFVDFMWTCEGIDFTRGPAYWLIAISALPFGTFGEMLGGDQRLPIPDTSCGETCANKWRGMLFGMTNRAGWNGVDPNFNREVWQLWDDFGIEDADMYGWWNTSSPVSTGSSTILATIYIRSATAKQSAATLVAIASWSTKLESVNLAIDYSRLGVDSRSAKLTPPKSVPNFNRNRTQAFDPKNPLPVPALEGWLLILD